MKSKLKYLAVSCLLSASMLGACASPPASNPSPATPSTPAAAAPQAEANVQVAVTRINDKAFNNKDFSQELQANPKAVLAAEGLSLAADENVKVLDFLNAEGKAYLILDDRNLERFYGEQIKNSPSDAEADEALKTFRAIRAKAQTEAEFKASLLADPATVLAAEGLNADAAKNIEVLDFEADTHYFLLLPPDQQVTRDSSEWCDLENNPFCPAPLPHLFMLNLGFNMLKSTSIGNVLRPEAIDLAVSGVYHTIEASCFWPRIFGASCGVPREDIKQGFYNAIRTTTSLTIQE